MKKTLQFILAFVISLSMFIIPSSISKAGEREEKSIDNNAIRIWTSSNTGRRWEDFKFLDMGDGSARLRLTRNGGSIIPPEEYPFNRILGTRLTVKCYDNEGSIYYSKQFSLGTDFHKFAIELSNIKFRYGLDGIQLIAHDGYYNEDTFAISGTVHSNLDNLNFGGINREIAQYYQFRLERDGLYSQYINQVRIPDGEYIIETAENSNRVLDILSGDNIGVSNYDSNRGNQKFILQYDNLNKAYKIIGKKYSNAVISWTSNQNANVMLYPDDNNNDQFWYLENAGNGRYRLISARNIYKWLNLDANNTNISVADRNSQSMKQQFKFVKFEEKETISGEWRIASKLNNNKVLGVNWSGGNVYLEDHDYGMYRYWNFEYDSQKGAYRITNTIYNGLLTGKIGSGNNVIADRGSLSNEKYWVLENTTDGYYIFKNYANQNMVLDVTDGNTSSGTNIQVYNRNNGDNQKFKLIR